MSNRKVLWYGIANFIPFAFFIFLGILMNLRSTYLLDYLSSTSSISGIIVAMIESANQNLSVLLPFVAVYVAIELINLRDIFKNGNIPPDRQSAWALTIVLTGIVGLPLYWYMNIYMPSKAELQNIEII